MVSLCPQSTSIVSLWPQSTSMVSFLYYIYIVKLILMFNLVVVCFL
jgi:hypothetical protein